ncbi:MAG: hypothetical protein HY830_21750 [Actinobacteria bacterium]|nr:hypothetical protein [Actinomycetota bacterium]
MSDGVAVLRERLGLVAAQRVAARRSLRLWRGLYWAAGIGAVGTAAAAGVSALGEILTTGWAAAFAAMSAVLTALDKFLNAGDKVQRVLTRHARLSVVEYGLAAKVVDAQWRHEALDPADADQVKAFADWLDESARAVDAEVVAVFEKTPEL